MDLTKHCSQVNIPQSEIIGDTWAQSLPDVVGPFTNYSNNRSLKFAMEADGHRCICDCNVGQAHTDKSMSWMKERTLGWQHNKAVIKCLPPHTHSSPLPRSSGRKRPKVQSDRLHTRNTVCDSSSLSPSSQSLWSQQSCVLFSQIWFPWFIQNWTTKLKAFSRSLKSMNTLFKANFKTHECFTQW